MPNKKTQLSLEEQLLKVIEKNSLHNLQDIKFVYNQVRSIDATLFIMNTADAYGGLLRAVSRKFRKGKITIAEAKKRCQKIDKIYTK